MASSSGQKFISRNRIPRVRIEYDVEVGGAEKRLELPLVIGVLADLAGNRAETPPRIEERPMREIDVENFEVHLKRTRAAGCVRRSEHDGRGSGPGRRLYV